MSPQIYRTYVLAVLTLVFTLNYLDRMLISLLLQPIKNDLGLSDTQLGFLTGIAFGIFYATLGVPIARWADRGNRVTIASGAIALWGITVMSCVLVGNFFQLICARVAAAVGESGCMPPTYSLVGDYFPAAAERGRAMAIYWLAAPLSSLIGFAAGGYLNAIYGWRITFLIMGVPGLLVAFLVKLTVKEPRREQQSHGEPPLAPPMSRVLQAVWRQRSARHLCFSIILIWTISIGLGPWYAAFLIRSHGMSTAEVGIWLALAFGGAGIGGNLLGGYVTGHLLANDEERQMRLSAALNALLVPLFGLFLLAPQEPLSILALMSIVVVWSILFAPTFALLLRLVGADMRATTLSLVMLLANLIGMGIGPQLVGILSDTLAPSFGVDSLRYAMLVMSLTALWVAYHFGQVARSVHSDLSTTPRAEPATQATACQAH